MAGYLRATAFREHRLRFSDIAVDYACNLSCTHCSALPMRSEDKPLLAVEDYRRIATDLRREGCVLFHFTGGEPLLRKDLEDIIQAFDPASSCISIQSNGMAATPRRLRSLRRSGVDIFCVSLDSGMAEEHDTFRRSPGSFQKTLAALQAARDEGLIVSVSACVSHQNLHSEGLRRLLDLTAELGVTCQFNLAVPIGHWKANTEVMLTTDDQEQVRALLRNHPHCRLDLYHNWSKVGCGTIKEKLYLSAYGDVLPCPFIPVAFGNLRDSTVAAVRKLAMEVPQFRDYWPSCLAAEDPEFTAQVARYCAAEPTTPARFDPTRWRAAGEATGDA
ncbi:radical SAM/SPASM domain-containing protein [Magnetospirillum sp. UT-4]|uniref:radical SAM/SPASM domain-containing protein n=1 Tax=Magnetospirillum sp. UT-4 TaxID=2681467 RepID=UPI00137F984A|nr:radical SAM/SPASM domain-containing protein [Magnetospirillum sp. UT-4]CAA7612121.1 putative oxidoreductase [Magnetospirillum sp. UT-4]